MTCKLSPTGLIPWFSKTEGNTYAALLHHPFLFKGKPTHAQEVAAAELGIDPQADFVHRPESQGLLGTSVLCLPSGASRVLD